MFDRLVPHLRLKSELHLSCPFCNGRKLEEITGDNHLSVFRKGEVNEEDGAYLDPSKWNIASAESASNLRQLVEQVAI